MKRQLRRVLPLVGGTLEPTIYGTDNPQAAIQRTISSQPGKRVMNQGWARLSHLLSRTGKDVKAHVVPWQGSVILKATGRIIRARIEHDQKPRSESVRNGLTAKKTALPTGRTSRDSRKRRRASLSIRLD